jgi:malonyl-CoA/methylmalonyl-CoA synthetase
LAHQGRELETAVLRRQRSGQQQNKLQLQLQRDFDFRQILIAPSLRSWSHRPDDIASSSDRYMDDNAPAFVIFTSGTTGRPKGAVHRRAMMHEVARSVADHYKVGEDDRILHLLPVHHATGAYLSFFPFLIRGASIEFRSGPFSADWTWERWKKGGISFFTGVPTMYVRMMRHFQHNNNNNNSSSSSSRAVVMTSSSSSSSSSTTSPSDEGFINSATAATTAAAAAAAATQIRGMLCGTSALPRPVEEFWETLRGGKRILTRYGSTESGAVFKMALEPGDTPSGSVGVCSPGVQVRFADGGGGGSGGDEGELLIKSPGMFMGYV